MRHDLISDVLSAIKNADNVGKKEITIPASKLVKEILSILQKNEYIGNFEIVEDRRGDRIVIQLFGKINNCGAIRPRFASKADEYEKYERRFLPASGVGLLIVSTSKGVMTFIDAKKNKIGGKMLAFIY